MFTVRRVVGASMEPTLREGALVVGCRFVRPKVGRIVLAEHDGLEIIKRIAKLGDKGVYVVGDNAAHSTDSRAYGWLPRAAIKSVIIRSVE